MNSIEDFNNVVYNYKFDFFPKNECYYDKLSEFTSIPYISLNYKQSNIWINSYCINNHESILPLNEFLIKYHPLYKSYQNFKFCNKCWIKLLYGKKTTNSFFTNHCDKCNMYFCSHKLNHFDKLKTVEKEFIDVKKFIFPICNKCNNKNFNNKIDGYKYKTTFLYYIKKNLLMFKNNLEEIEKDFQNICGKDYISLYPYYEYYMRNNYLELLLCENLIKTYSSLILRKEMYYQVIKNIQNIIIPKFKFQLNQIKDTKLLIEYFKQTNNCLLNEGKSDFNNSFLFQIDFSFSSHFFESYSKITTFFIFPEKKLIFQLNKALKKIYILHYNKKKITIALKEVPLTILYLRDNLFIFQYSQSFILYSFEKNYDFVEKNIFHYSKFLRTYSKIIELKHKKFICYSEREVNIFLYNSDSKSLIQEKIIYDIAFIKRINENLIFFSYGTYFDFMDNFGRKKKKIDFLKLKDNFLFEKQICVYKNFLIIISQNLNIYLIDLHSLDIRKCFNFYDKLLKEFTIYKDDIMFSENNKLTLYCGKFMNDKDIVIKQNEYESHYPLIVENKYGLIIYDNGCFYLLYNIENCNTLIIELFKKFQYVKNMFLYDKQIYLIQDGEYNFNYISFFE